MEQKFDVRALIGATEKEVVNKVTELGYSHLQNTQVYGSDKTIIFQLYETNLGISFVKDIAVSITVVDPNPALREWLAKETQPHPEARLEYPVPAGLKAEIRKDDHFWYSLRIAEDRIGVTITSRTGN